MSHLKNAEFHSKINTHTIHVFGHSQHLIMTNIFKSCLQNNVHNAFNSVPVILLTGNYLTKLNNNETATKHARDSTHLWWQQIALPTTDVRVQCVCSDTMASALGRGERTRRHVWSSVYAASFRKIAKNALLLCLFFFSSNDHTTRSEIQKTKNGL